MKIRTILAFLIVSAPAAAALAGPAETNTAMGQLLNLQEVSAPLPALPGMEVSAAPQETKVRETACYFLGDQVVAIDPEKTIPEISRILEKAGYVVVSSYLSTPTPENFLEFYSVDIRFEAAPGGVTRRPVTKRSPGYDTREAAEAARVERLKAIEKEGGVILYTAVLTEYSPFDGWFFRADYILPSGA